MALDTYTNLQASILAWLNRVSDADAATRCPDWITLAEDEMRMALNRLMVRQGEVNNATFAINSEYTALPSGFYRFRSIKINSTPIQPLEYVSPQLADRWDSLATPNLPRLYTIQNNQLRVFPPPDAAYTATITYYALPSLSVSNASNWMLAAHPKLYLKAALAEAYDYYENNDKFAQNTQERERMISALSTSDSSDQQGTAMRIRTDNGSP